MKQRIRINESQLRRIAEESVKRIIYGMLNEQDWRFEMLRNRPERINREKAQDAFNKKHGSSESDGKRHTYVDGYINDKPSVRLSQNYSDDGLPYNPFSNKDNHYQGRVANFGLNGMTTGGTRNTDMIDNPSNEMLGKFNDACNDFKDFYSGNFGSRIKDKAHKLPNWSSMGSEFRNLGESQLRRIVSESVKRCLNEMNENREIFTLDVFDLTNDESKDDFQVTSRTYYDLDEAILAAQTAAREYSEDDDVIEVNVMRGEYEKPNGEIYGEPDVIFTASNKDKRSTAIAREKAGYTSLKVDFYAL